MRWSPLSGIPDYSARLTQAYNHGAYPERMKSEVVYSEYRPPPFKIHLLPPTQNSRIKRTLVGIAEAESRCRRHPRRGKLIPNSTRDGVAGGRRSLDEGCLCWSNNADAQGCSASADGWKSPTTKTSKLIKETDLEDQRAEIGSSRQGGDMKSA